MSENTKLESLVKTAMEKIREMTDCETVIGKPIVTSDGTTVIPVSKVSFGFASAEIRHINDMRLFRHIFHDGKSL